MRHLKRIYYTFIIPCQRKTGKNQWDTVLILFSFQESPFPFDSPAIAAQFAVFADHPMAWRDDRHWIGRAGAGHGAGCCRFADPAGQFAVGDGPAAGYAAQFFPDAHLKGRPLYVQRQCRVGRLSGETIEQRFHLLPQMIVVPPDLRLAMKT